MSETNLGSILLWCASNEVSFRIILNDGVPFIRAGSNTLWSDWEIERADIESVSNALAAALRSVKAGNEFHAKYGAVPDPEALRNREGRS